MRSGSRRFFTSPMKDFGYDVSDYRDVDPMFGTLGRFRRAGRRGASTRPEGDDRPGAFSHTSDQHPLVQGKPRRAATIRRPTGMSGPIPSRTARRPTTGCRSSAVRPGSGTPRRMQYLHAQFSADAAGPELPSTPSPGRAARRRRASGSSAASTGSGSTRSISTSTRPDWRTIRRCRRSERNDSDRAVGEPLQFPGSPLRQEPAGESGLPAARSARCSTNIRPSPRSARWATRSAGWRSLPTIPPAVTGCRCATPSTSSRRTKSARRSVSFRCSNDFGKVASDGWACWAFSNHDVVRHATRWGAGEATATPISRSSRRC